jgi:hypothetical protein
MAGKCIRFFDKDKAIYEWLKINSPGGDHWMYMPSGTVGLPDRVHFFDLELASLCLLTWPDRRAKRRYDEQGRHAGYSNEE